MKVALRIGTLSVHGLALTRAERAALGDLVESELRRLVADGTPCSAVTSSVRPADLLGIRVAEAVHAALPPLPFRPAAGSVDESGRRTVVPHRMSPPSVVPEARRSAPPASRPGALR
jgi:hypothetical protein